MYNTATKKSHPGGSLVNRILFRSLCAVIILTLLVSAIKFSTHRQGLAGFICLIFSIVISVFVIIKKNPTAGAWFSLIGIVLLAIMILVVLEM